MRRLLLLIPVLIFLSNCTVSGNFGEKADSNKLAIQTAGERNWTITHSDFEAGFFSAHYPQTLKNWDDEVNVSIHDNLNDTITIKSTLEPSAKRNIGTNYLNAL